MSTRIVIPMHSSAGSATAGEWHMEVEDDGTLNRQLTSSGILPGNDCYASRYVDAALLGAALELDKLRKRCDGTPECDSYQLLQESKRRSAENLTRALEAEGKLAVTYEGGSPTAVQEANGLRQQLENMRSRMERAEDAVVRATEWKAALIVAAHQEANDRGYCSDFDDFMEANGLPRRKRTYVVTRRYTRYEYCSESQTVEAEDEDEAQELADANPDGWGDTDYGDSDTDDHNTEVEEI